MGSVTTSFGKDTSRIRIPSTLHRHVLADSAPEICRGSVGQVALRERSLLLDHGSAGAVWRFELTTQAGRY